MTAKRLSEGDGDCVPPPISLFRDYPKYVIFALITIPIPIPITFLNSSEWTMLMSPALMHLLVNTKNLQLRYDFEDSGFQTLIRDQTVRAMQELRESMSNFDTISNTIDIKFVMQLIGFSGIYSCLYAISISIPNAIPIPIPTPIGLIHEFNSFISLVQRDCDSRCLTDGMVMATLNCQWDLLDILIDVSLVHQPVPLSEVTIDNVINAITVIAIANRRWYHRAELASYYGADLLAFDGAAFALAKTMLMGTHEEALANIPPLKQEMAAEMIVKQHASSSSCLCTCHHSDHPHLHPHPQTSTSESAGIDTPSLDTSDANNASDTATAFGDGDGDHKLMMGIGIGLGAMMVGLCIILCIYRRLGCGHHRRSKRDSIKDQVLRASLTPRPSIDESALEWGTLPGIYDGDEHHC